MLKTVLAACALLCALTINAEARQRHKAGGLHPECNITMPCLAPYASTPDQVRVARGRYIARQMGFGSAIEKRAVRAPKARRAAVGKSETYRRMTGIIPAISGIVAPLAAKVAEIQSACGARVVSAVRHTRIAGTRRMSLHASGQAVDLTGPPNCMYGLLANWSGGASTDYARVRHLHLSWGGPEHGLRFAHGGHRHAKRHARHRYARYARARL